MGDTDKVMSRITNFIRNLNYLTKHSLWDQREADIVYLTNKILDDGVYEYGLDLHDSNSITILSQEQSLTLLEKSPKSFVRTGDGEIKLMMGMDQPFQKYEKEIADSLKNSLSQYRSDMYIGINRNYFIPLYDHPGPDYYRRNAFDFRQFYRKYLNPEIQYIDAAFTLYVIGQKQSVKYDEIFNRWRKLFEGRDLVIVCGEGILNKLEYDVFELASTKRLIEGPRINAWEKHHQLIEEIETTVDKNSVVAFILGMAGKAMIPELTDKGYMCWDIGHLAKCYNAYKTQLEGTPENIKDFYAPD